MNIEVQAGVLQSADEAAVRAVIATAQAFDGVPPISEQNLHALRRGAMRSVIAREGAVVTGYAAMDITQDVCTSELVVAPEHRRHGVGRALAEQVLSTAGDAVVRVWAHGNHPGATSLAKRLSFAAVRELRQLRMRLPEAPASPLPPDVSVRPFRPGRDDDAWLSLNSTAFAGHPEQGRWTLQDLQSRVEAPWFDPSGFLLAERDGQLLGFHWTKRHSPALGEVYVIGVDPSAQGTGLGKALLGAGLSHLRRTGAEEVLLYVDADNSAAVAMYERTGFRTAATDVMYERVSSGGHPTV